VSKRANPARKTPKDRWMLAAGHLVGRKRELDAAPLEEVLAELGRVVGRYAVQAYPLWDGRPVWEGRGWRDEGRTFCYAVSYEMRRPGRPLFVCGGKLPDPFYTLHEAAVWALMGALAWVGAPEEEEAA
jgi:hypothetical protein